MTRLQLLEAELEVAWREGNDQEVDRLLGEISKEERNIQLSLFKEKE